jgi:hypothetical protein
MLAMALTFGLVLTGCPNSTTEETDTWSDVTNLSQLGGTWKGSYSETMAFKEMAGDAWNDEMQTTLGDVKVAISAEITVTINAAAKTQVMSTTMTQTFSGGNIGTAWSFISSMVSGQEGITVDNAKHSVTMTQTQPATTLSDEDIADMLAAGLKINQNGTKVKLPADTLGSGSPEITLIKQ